MIFKLDIYMYIVDYMILSKKSLVQCRGVLCAEVWTPNKCPQLNSGQSL